MWFESTGTTLPVRYTALVANDGSKNSTSRNIPSYKNSQEYGMRIQRPGQPFSFRRHSPSPCGGNIATACSDECGSVALQCYRPVQFLLKISSPNGIIDFRTDQYLTGFLIHLIRGASRDVFFELGRTVRVCNTLRILQKRAATRTVLYCW